MINFFLFDPVFCSRCIVRSPVLFLSTISVSDPECALCKANTTLISPIRRRIFADATRGLILVLLDALAVIWDIVFLITSQSLGEECLIDN